MSAEHVKVITTNRRARFEYHVESKLECGIALKGTEVKSLRERAANLEDAYAKIDDAVRSSAPAEDAADRSSAGPGRAARPGRVCTTPCAWSSCG